MKIITLHQPFATLMMLGLKTNETRSWDTKYRGILGIHAAAKIPKYCQELLDEPLFIEALAGIELPTGKILGTVELISTMSTTDWLFKASLRMGSLFETNFKRYEQETEFGNYDPGRFAWQTINPTPFDEPIPARGFQGFWNYPLL